MLKSASEMERPRNIVQLQLEEDRKKAELKEYLKKETIPFPLHQKKVSNHDKSIIIQESELFIRLRSLSISLDQLSEKGLRYAYSGSDAINLLLQQYSLGYNNFPSKNIELLTYNYPAKHKSGERVLVGDRYTLRFVNLIELGSKHCYKVGITQQVPYSEISVASPELLVTLSMSGLDQNIDDNKISKLLYFYPLDLERIYNLLSSQEIGIKINKQKITKMAQSLVLASNSKDLEIVNNTLVHTRQIIKQSRKQP